jgi:hypothetical protein
MRPNSFIQLGLFAVLLAGLSGVAQAQTAIETIPSGLTLKGSRCLFGNCVQPQTLSIQPSAAIANVEVVALPFTRTDGLSVPTAILPGQLPIRQVAAQRALIIPFTFDPNLLPSGEFKGELLITYDGGSRRVPVVVQVKDHWLGPLALLVVGVILGMVVSAYRDQGRPRDQVIVRLGQLRSQILNDAEFDRAKSFQEWIQDHFVDVETALQNRQFATAETAVVEAETLWIKWRKGREDWIELMAYHQQLTQQLTQLSQAGMIEFTQILTRQMNDVMKNMAKAEGPEQLRDQLEAIAKQIYHYSLVLPKLTQLLKLAQSLPDQEAPLKEKAQALQQQVTHMRPIDLNANIQPQLQEILGAMEATEQQIEGAIAQAKPLVPSQPRSPGMENVGRGAATEMFSVPFAIAPAVRPVSLEQQVVKAGQRLRLFGATSYAIAVLFLAGAGFLELYGDKPTFGAMPWRDYFSLLAWGFGAEATRDAVTKTVKNWQLTGVK